jgi:hypothetical protein
MSLAVLFFAIPAFILPLLHLPSPASAADRDTPAAREEREHRWREERRERDKTRKNRELEDRKARKRRDAIDARRERDWQRRLKSLDVMPVPENAPPAAPSE